MKVMPDSFGLINFEIVLAFHTGHHQVVKIYYDELVRINSKIQIEALISVYFSTLVIKSNIDLNVFPLIAFHIKALQKNHHIQDPFIFVELIGGHLYFWSQISTDDNTLALMNEQLASELASLTSFNLDHLHAGFRAGRDGRSQ